MMRNDMRFLGNLASGEPVYDRHSSHLHREVQELLPEIFAGVSSGTERFMVHEHDFGRIVGYCNCVATSGSDTVVWAQRPKRAGLTRFVKNRQPEPSTKAVIILKRDIGSLGYHSRNFSARKKFIALVYKRARKINTHIQN